MENINEAIAVNMKQLRERQRLSLDALAKRTGVSKSMLGQIERCEANPSISTVWKIANGLKVSFTELLAHSEKDVEVIDKAQVSVLCEDNGRFRNYPLFLFDSPRKFEIYYIEIEPGSSVDAAAHPHGTQEFLTVFSGRLRVCVDQEVLTADSGCALRFKADLPHVYENIGAELCRVSMVISYSA